MMRLLFLLSGFLFCASVQALDWKSDITLSPQPMTYSGPADSVVPGSIIGSTWSATASVQQVFWCGIVFTCNKGTLQPSSSAITSGATVTVDGVSLTVAARDDTGFEVALIPHTLGETTLGAAREGQVVNLEVDLVAKYVEALVAPYRSAERDT